MPTDPITDLTLKISKPELPLKYKLQAICTAISTSIEACNRVSIWFFNEALDEIFCAICKDHENGYSLGHQIFKDDVKSYFEHILQYQVLKASYAREHQATKCFNESYFYPNNIHSLLDYVFHHESTPMGVMCCERVGDPVDWSARDVENLKQISRITSMFFAQDILIHGKDRERILSLCQL